MLEKMLEKLLQKKRGKMLEKKRLCPQQASQIIKKEMSDIINNWENRVRQDTPVARLHERLVLIDSLPNFLKELAQCFDSPIPKINEALGQKTAIKHGLQRAELGDYTIEQVVLEFHILREILIERLEINESLAPPVQKILHAFIDRGIQKSSAYFSDFDKREKAAEARIVQAERQRLQDVFAQTPIPMVLFMGPDLQFTLVNQPALEILQRTKADVIGKSFSEVMRKEEIEAGGFLSALKKVYETGQAYVAKEFFHPNSDQNGAVRDRYLDLGYYPYYESEKVVGVLTFNLDVSDKVLARKQAEESALFAVQAKDKLEQSERRFLQLSDNLESQVLHIMEFHPPKISFVGRAYEKVWGRSLESLYLNPMSFLDAIHPEDRPLMDEVVEKQFRGESSQMIYRIFQPNGNMRWIKDKATPVFDKNGKPERAVGLAEDITDAMNASLELAAEKLKIESVFQNSPGINAILGGPEFVLEKVNTKFTELFGSRNLVGKKFADAFPEYAKYGSFKLLDEVYRTGQPYVGKEVEVPLQLSADQDPQKTFWDFVYVRIEDASGKPYGIYNFSFDVTEKVLARKSLEKVHVELIKAKNDAEAASEIKSAFLANMSHEIRTPLSSVLGFCRLLKEDAISPEEKDRYLDTIVRNSTALATIIDDILDLAKVEAGHLEIEIIEFAVIVLVQEAIDLFSEAAKEKGIYLSLDIDVGVPEKICSDPTRLRQILVNLIGNAVKFTFEGGVRIRIKSESVSESEICIEIDVEDTGVGLTDDEKQKLFQPFVQADSSTTRKFGGTGLGLVLSQRLSQALKGHISILDCSPKKGCTFHLEFLAQPAIEGKKLASRKSRNLKAPADQLKGLRILVVDDSRDIQFLVSRLLAKNGAVVETASDGDEGVQKAISSFYDIVLMDIQMPKMDGFEAKQILDKKGCEAPIIALTAHAMKEDRQKTKSLGFSGHLTKPIVPDEFISTIAKVVAVSKSARL